MASPITTQGYSPSTPTNPKRLNILLPSLGKKASLASCLRNALSPNDRLIGTDENPDNTLRALTHSLERLPATHRAEFTPALERLIEQQQINVVIPTRQAEFSFWNKFTQSHQEIFVALSGPKTLEACASKSASYELLKFHNLPCAPYLVWKNQSAQQLEVALGPVPYFSKPNQGAGSMGTRVIKTYAQLNELSAGDIIQPYFQNTDEYTINAYVDKKGNCRCVIPHKRVVVRNGEIAIAHTYAHRYFDELAQRVITALGDCFGPINFQVFHAPQKETPSDHSCVISDINPRFGGGYPLTHQAGAPFVEWLIAEVKGQELTGELNCWHNNYWLGR